MKHKSSIRIIVFSLIVITCLMVQPMAYFKVNAQEGPRGIPIDLNLRVHALISISEETLRGLQNLAASLTGNASLLVAQASGELSRALEDFKRITRDTVEIPLRNLSASVQDMGRQLYSATVRLNQILALQQKCFFQNLQPVLSGLQNVTLELKAFPLAPSSSPRLYYLQFNNQAPSVLPKEGGNFVVFGFKLWGGRAPQVSLMDETKQNVVKQLTATRAADNNSFASTLDTDTIKNNSGKCLQLRVQLEPNRPNKDLFMPVCIPKFSNLQFKVVAGFQYQCPRTEKRTLDARNYTRYNESCENRLPVGEALIWDIPGECSIIEKKDDNAGDRHTSQVQWTISGRNSITASGWLDTASCVDVRVPCPSFGDPFRTCSIGRKLNSSTVYNHNITATLSCSLIDKKEAKSPAPEIFDAEYPQKRAFVNLDADCDSNQNNFWFTITPVVDGVDQRTFESGITPIGGDGGTATIVVQKGYTVNASFNPRRTPAGKVQLALIFDFPSCQ